MAKGSLPHPRPPNNGYDAMQPNRERDMVSQTPASNYWKGTQVGDDRQQSKPPTSAGRRPGTGTVTDKHRVTRQTDTGIH